MRLRHLGYAGQNLSTGCTTGRTLRLANLTPERVAEVTAANLADLRSILAWNVDHGIHFFRMGSSLVPFASHPDFAFDWESYFEEDLAEIARFVDENQLRLSMHPGQYTVLNSPTDSVVTNAINELEYHASVLKKLAPESGTYTLHLGGAYGDREAALLRLVDNAERLSPDARGRLALENDDKIFDVDDALWVADRLGAPVVFDIFHHRYLNRRGNPYAQLSELLEQVIATWGSHVPKLHLSSAREPTKSAHAEYIEPQDLIETLEVAARVGGTRPFDLMLEAKAKDLALLDARSSVPPFHSLTGV